MLSASRHVTSNTNELTLFTKGFKFRILTQALKATSNWLAQGEMQGGCQLEAKRLLSTQLAVAACLCQHTPWRKEKEKKHSPTHTLMGGAKHVNNMAHNK